VENSNLVFVVGLPRSGTTLVSLLLSNCAEVLAPPEPWLLLALENLLNIYPHHPSDGILISKHASDFINHEELDSGIVAFYESVVSKKLKQAGKSIFVDKTPRYWSLLPKLPILFPDAKIVIVLRNPLDIAASYKTTWDINILDSLEKNEKTPEVLDFVIGLRMLASSLKSEQNFVLRYEELALLNQSALNDLTSYLGVKETIDISEQYITDEEVKRLAEYNVGDQKALLQRRVHGASVDAWKSTFLENEAQAFCRQIGYEVFHDLGYMQVYNDLLGDKTSSTFSAAKVYKSVSVNTAIQNSIDTLMRLGKFEFARTTMQNSMREIQDAFRSPVELISNNSILDVRNPLMRDDVVFDKFLDIEGDETDTWRWMEGTKATVLFTCEFCGDFPFNTNIKLVLSGIAKYQSVFISINKHTVFEISLLTCSEKVCAVFQVNLLHGENVIEINSSTSNRISAENAVLTDETRDLSVRLYKLAVEWSD